MNKNQYIKEALRQLNDPEFYLKITSPIYPRSIPKIKEILNKLLQEGYINKKQAIYLIGEGTPRPRHFYILPKIHKDKSTWHFPDIPPGRPIVSDCNRESYRIAEYIDYYLNPLSNKHDSYLKDTYDFIE